MKKHGIIGYGASTCLLKPAFAIAVWLADPAVQARAQTYCIPGDTTTTCAGTFYDSGCAGGNYANNEDTVTTFCSADGNKYLQVFFTSFNTQSNADYLYVYDGPSISSPRIGTYHGNWGANTHTVRSSSKGGCLTFHFISNSFSTAAGWEASISCVDSVACETVTFTDPGGGGNYAYSDTLIRTFCSTNPAQVIQAVFPSFAGVLNQDYLYVYDGPSTSSPRIATYHGDWSVADTIRSSVTGGCLTFRFISNSISNDQGWEATISCVDSTYYHACNTKIFKDPGGSGNYANSDTLLRTFCSNNPAMVVQAVLPSFAGVLNQDHLYVYDGPSASSPLIAAYHGDWSGPDTVRSSVAGGCLTFSFISGSSSNDQGWDASISCVDSSYFHSCQEKIFRDPGGPGNYADNVTVVRTYCSDDPGKEVMAVFPTFDGVTGQDALSIYDGPSTGSPLIRTYNSDFSVADTIRSSAGGCLTFGFTSNSFSNAQGWEASVSCVDSTGGASGISESNFSQALHLYPNPTDGHFTVDLGESYREIWLEVRNALGQQVAACHFNQSSVVNISVPGPGGLYIVTIHSSKGETAFMKIIKK